MENYLLAWNPEKWEWPDLHEKLNNFKNDLPVLQEWSTRNRKIKIGDRVFMIRLGRQPKGVFASGIVTEIDIQAPHYVPEAALEGIIIPFVKFKFEILLDSEKSELIDEGALKNKPFDSQHWHIQASGAHLQPNVADSLYRQLSNILPSVIPAIEEVIQVNEYNLYEGTVQSINVNRYERNPYARKACIEQYGYSCQVCDFNFEKQFGEIGKNYIHVHHVKPLSEIKKGYCVDPIKDLIPVCPNCHAMIHNSKTTLSIQDLRNILAKIN